MPIDVTPETKKQIITSVRAFWHKKFDEELGDLRAELLFDHFMELVGAVAYNKGVSDARTYLQSKLIDLEIELHEEVPYSK